MSLRFVAAVGCITALLGLGCTSVFDLDRYTVGDSADGAPTSPTRDAPDGHVDDAARTDGPAASEDAGGSRGDAAPDAACSVNADCVVDPMAGGGDGGGPATVCVRATGQCAALQSVDCPSVFGDYSNDDAVIIGTYFATAGAGATLNLPRQQAALLAAQEIDSSGAGGLPPAMSQGGVRPLVVVQCDPSTNPMRTAQHLIQDLHVPAIVGPDADQDVIEVTQNVSATEGTLLMSPSAQASTIATLSDSGLTTRDVPADDQRAALVLDQLNELQAILLGSRGPLLKLGIVYRNDVTGQSAFSSISGTLRFNGQPITAAANASYVSVDTYDVASDVAAQTAIGVKYGGFNPDIVFITAPEQIPNVVIPLEQSLTLSNATKRPYYLFTEAGKVSALLSGASQPNVPSDFPSRLRGVGVTPDAASAQTFAAFNAAFTSAYGSNPQVPDMGTSYDAMYSIAYAIAATADMPVSGPGIAKGLSMLGSGTTVSVGAAQASATLQSLASGRSIALQGTFTAMQWDGNGDIAGGTLEVWCVGVSSGAPAFAGSGRTLDVGTQTLSGAYSPCQ
jgi:hypothetical protein